VLKELLAVGLGGAVGSIARYSVIMLSARIFGSNYTHYGTLVVNCIGSFLVTFFMVLYIERFEFDPIVRLIVVVGFLGGFTTFSAFSYESVAMFHAGEFKSAIANILLSNILGLSFALIGVYAAKRLI